MINKYKTISREVKYLLLPIIFFGLFFFYLQSRNKISELTIHSTNFDVIPMGEYGYRPMGTFQFWITYAGRKPEWWGKQGSICWIKDFKLVDRNGQVVQAAPFTIKRRQIGKLDEIPGGYSPTQEIYLAYVTMSIPPNRPVNGGTISATLQIVESVENPKKIYIETKINIIADIDCNYEGC